MAITKRTKKTGIEDFIAAAPDAQKGIKKGRRLQISLTIAPALLDKVDRLAEKLGQSRAALINMAIYRAVEHGLMIEGLHDEEP